MIVIIHGMIDCGIKRYGNINVNADQLLFSSVLVVLVRAHIIVYFT